MAKLQYRSISRRTVEALRAEKDTVYWDNELTGFGIRVYPGGTKVYMVQSRGPGGLKRVTVGRHGVISADRRRRAALIIAHIKAGEAPLATPMAREATGPTVADLAERYFREHVVVRCKPGTAKLHRRVVRKHILPGFGKLPVAAIGREHVTDLHYRLRQCPGHGEPGDCHAVTDTQPGRDLGSGSGRRQSLPLRGQVQAAQAQRFLTEEEFRRLGRVLGALEATGRVAVHAAAAIRLLMLTGYRRNEILTLRWEDVHRDVNELRLRDSKTGVNFLPMPVESFQCHAMMPN